MNTSKVTPEQLRRFAKDWRFHGDQLAACGLLGQRKKLQRQCYAQALRNERRAKRMENALKDIQGGSPS